CAVTSNTCDDTNYGSPYDSVDMVRNYMQYSDNACVNIFTTGQKNRMRIVMGEKGTGSPRRESLRFSDRSMTKPKISFIRTDTAVIERTSCNFPWGFNIPVKISHAPTGTTYASLTITGNTNGQDYTITPDSLSFSPTDSADKYFTVIMNPDAVMEGHEQAFFTLTVNDTNSIPAPDPYELLIFNDDNMPVMGKRFSGTFFAEDFENPSAGWIKYDYIKGSNKWLIGGTNGDVINGKSAYISKDSSSLSYNAGSKSHTLMYHEIPAYNWDSLYLSFYYKCNGQTSGAVKKDFGKLMYSLDSLNFFQVNGTIDLADSSNTTYFGTMLPSFLWNTKFYLGFYWQNDTATANNPPFAIDDIAITGKTYIPSFIQTAVDTATGYDQKPLGPMQTVNFYDRFTGDILATIQNLSGFNYGCVSVAVDRAGTGAQYVNNDPAVTIQNKLFDKTYKVTPQYNNSSGSYSITFYLTQAEINGWMLASGNNFNNAWIIKDTGHISNTDFYGPFEQQLAIKGNFPGGRTITSPFNTGFSGFGFGRINTSILPVHLISFTATEKNKTALLNWKVDNELSIVRYAIQRSSDGINFAEVGSNPATGVTGVIQYAFTDAQPPKGWNYYRLAIYDNDGKFKFSQIERLYFGNNVSYTIAPNPFTDKIKITATNKETAAITYTITDISGKAMISGSNPALLPGQTITINTQRLAAGMYHLKLISADDIQQFKIIKQ
ncbi:MAG: T9SS type A sorting domain-containing protein, partial [Ferruginibacter sp.]